MLYIVMHSVVVLLVFFLGKAFKPGLNIWKGSLVLPPVSVIRNSFETPTTVHRHVEDAARALHQGPDEGH
jgi:hypothetical protein